MDDYLAKPFSSAELNRVLVKWLTHIMGNKTGEKSPVEPNNTSPVSSMYPLDAQQLAEVKATMGPCSAALIKKFIHSGDALLRSLYQALAAADSEQLMDLAHDFKNNNGNIGATELFELCQMLEHEHADLATAERLIQLINSEYTQVTAVLHELGE